MCSVFGNRKCQGMCASSSPLYESESVPYLQREARVNYSVLCSPALIITIGACALYSVLHSEGIMNSDFLFFFCLLKIRTLFCHTP